VITSSRERAVDRVVATRGLSREEVERRIGNQISETERTRDADCVIRNDGSLAELRAEIERCWRGRVARAQSESEE
jgi:dephospho-CoA kinase